MFIYVVVCIYLSLCDGYVFSSFVPRKSALVACLVSIPLSKDQVPSPFTSWYNPTYSVLDIDNWWRKRDPLLSIGAAGVTISHRNSLRNMLNHHNAVRVKLATDRLDPFIVAHQLVTKGDETQNPDFTDNIEVLEVRQRCIMFGKTK
jgi:hypothetical protein